MAELVNTQELTNHMAKLKTLGYSYGDACVIAIYAIPVLRAALLAGWELDIRAPWMRQRDASLRRVEQSQGGAVAEGGAGA